MSARDAAAQAAMARHSQSSSGGGGQMTETDARLKERRQKDHHHDHRAAPKKDIKKYGFVLIEASLSGGYVPGGPRSSLPSGTQLYVSQKLFSMPLGASVITDALSVHGVTPSLYEAYKQRLFADAKDGASVSVDHRLLIKMLEDEV